MFARAFSNPSKSLWFIQGAGIIWLFGCFALLYQYEIETLTALVDSALFSIFFLIGVGMLDRVFGFYIPKGKNSVLLFIVPLFYSFIAVLLHQWLLKKIFLDDVTYLNLLNDSFYLRFAFLGMAETLVALLAIIISKLEQQEESRARENVMNELSKEAELSQLRQQLQPHFLFNSLNSISSLVVSQPMKAREMVLQLSDFLRGTIKKDHQKWVSLEEELNYLKMYLEIEQVRFGHRLTVDITISEDAKSMEMPQLLIQPLLENAIKHGLYGVTEEVKITLVANKAQGYLVLKIENPFDSEISAPKGAGFGLSSVERRLFLIFGRKDLLQSSAQDAVFSVLLKIPQKK